jgi:signal peptidase I
MNFLGNPNAGETKMSLSNSYSGGEASEKNKKQTPVLIELIESFITSFVVLMVIYVFIAFPEVVSGASMEPFLYDGERILVEKVTPHFKPYERGDVIIFHPPSKDDIDYVKRVVGLPGEIVKISDCRVYITSEGEKFVMEEPYLYEDICTTGGVEIREGRALKLEDNEYFVLGDNRPKSADSRILGPITKDRLVGKVIFRFWPPSVTGFL